MGQIAQSVWSPFYTLYIHTRKNCTRSICLTFLYFEDEILDDSSIWNNKGLEYAPQRCSSCSGIHHDYCSCYLFHISIVEPPTSIWCKTHFTNHPVSRMSISFSIDKSLLHIAKLTYTSVFAIQIVLWKIYYQLRKDFKIFSI